MPPKTTATVEPNTDVRIVVTATDCDGHVVTPVTGGFTVTAAYRYHEDSAAWPVEQETALDGQQIKVVVRGARPGEIRVRIAVTDPVHATKTVRIFVEER